MKIRRRRRTKIIATLGPSSSTPEVLARLFQTGADVFRLNFSHGSHEDHAARIALFLFDKDEYDPDPPARTELAERAIGEKGNPRLVMRPAGITGHSAAGGRDFTLRYAPCLVRFIESVTPGPFTCAD